MITDTALPALVAALPELYQPVYGHPEHAAPQRACEDRLARLVAVHDALAAALGRPLRVLDLGCAQGYFCFELAARGASVRGVDADASSIALCRALGAEHPGLDVVFEEGSVEAALDELAPGGVDLVIGLSVFHHLVYRHGFDPVRERLERLLGQVAAGVFELALGSEPLYWADAQPADPWAFFVNVPFCHQLDRFPTHLSAVERPLFVASASHWVLPPDAGAIDAHLAEPHAYAKGHYRGSRRYFRSGDQLLKLYRYDVDPAFDNAGELAREAALLASPPPDFPTPALYDVGETDRAGWLRRAWLPGRLLSECLDADRPEVGERALGELLDQLVALEAAGLYHEDLRAWNLLRLDSGELRLIDYGSIRDEPGDRAWPGNPWLSFIILVHELLGADLAHPEPLRTASLSPWGLPPPYRAWLLAFWERPFAAWSFAALRDALAQTLAEQPARDAAELLPGQAWARAVEQGLTTLSRHADYLQWSQAQQRADAEAQAYALRKLGERSERAEDERLALREAQTGADARLAALEADGEALRQALQERQALEEERQALQEELLARGEALEHLTRERDALLASASWRLTAPLRALVDAAGAAPGRLRAAGYAALQALARFVLQRPRLRALGLRVLARLPGLERWLQRALLETEAPPPGAAAGAPAPPPRALHRARLALARAAAARPAQDETAAAAARPTLAYLSPLPPARSGIADYSAELLPALAAHYAITLVNLADAPPEPLPGLTLPVIDVATFRSEAGRFDHVLYQLGNSEFHAAQVALLEDIPGVVVLHDFFLGHLHAARDYIFGERGALAAALLEAHGLPALRVLADAGVEEALRRYPANAGVLSGATAVIVHSAHARELGAAWLGEAWLGEAGLEEAGLEEAGPEEPAAAPWQVIPHLRQLPPRAPERAAARRALGLDPDSFIVASFGFLTPSKCNVELADAWRQSGLGARADCQLVYVGKQPDGDYGRAVDRAREGLGNSRVTGFAARDDYRHWLAAADVAVQLRRDTRGESSGTVLDCLAHGLPLVANAHGSLAELPAEAVYRLDEAFTVDELADALLTLHGDGARRARLGARARDHIAAGHAPALIASRYAQAIARSARSPLARLEQAARAPAAPPGPGDDAEARALALALEQPAAPRWFVDITALRVAAHVTGIERVTEAQLLYLLEEPPPGVRVVPVYADPDHGYREANDYLAGKAGLPPGLCEPQILPRAGDLFVGLDWVPGAVIAQRATLEAWRHRGVQLWYQVYDVLPVTNPEWFPSHVPPVFTRWLDALGELADGCLCISGATADRLAGWWRQRGVAAPPALAVAHLGADLPDVNANVEADAGPPVDGLPAHYLLMVGTIEPRKGHRQALAALEQLWREGSDLHLVIVGREGWRAESAADRAPVAALARLLREHPEQGRRLRWYDNLDDPALVYLYRHAAALLGASEDEGFGLPLVEAAFFGTPRILRDIPVFRELAGDYATYFSAPPATDPRGDALAAVLRRWLAEPPPRMAAMPLTWADNGRRVRAILAAAAGPVKETACGTGAGDQETFFAG